MNNFDPREHVGLLIKFLNGKITNKVNKNLVKFNLTCVQHEILCFINKNEKERDVFQKDIERCLKLTNPTVTGIIKRLEEKQMIVRCPSSIDARYKCLHVTEKGKDLICKSFKFYSVLPLGHLRGTPGARRNKEKIVVEKSYSYGIINSLENTNKKSKIYINIWRSYQCQ